MIEKNTLPYESHWSHILWSLDEYVHIYIHIHITIWKLINVEWTDLLVRLWLYFNLQMSLSFLIRMHLSQNIFYLGSVETIYNGYNFMHVEQE